MPRLRHLDVNFQPSETVGRGSDRRGDSGHHGPRPLQFTGLLAVPPDGSGMFDPAAFPQTFDYVHMSNIP